MLFTFIIIANLCACHKPYNPQHISKKQKIPAGSHKHLWSRIRHNYDMTPKQVEAKKQAQIQKYVQHYREKKKHWQE